MIHLECNNPRWDHTPKLQEATHCFRSTVQSAHNLVYSRYAAHLWFSSLYPTLAWSEQLAECIHKRPDLRVVPGTGSAT